MRRIITGLALLAVVSMFCGCRPSGHADQPGWVRSGSTEGPVSDICFGMKKADVLAIKGKPDRVEVRLARIVWTYVTRRGDMEERLVLTFGDDERVGVIEYSDRSL